jgi:pimeloyl-ACP methyl ester carboxylesterase
MPHLIKTPNFELAVYLRGSPQAHKLALLLPGRLDTKDYPHMRSHVDFLASKGFLALSFDPPGTWESPGSIEIYTMTNYLAAINELIDYFGKKPTVLMGHSRGGSMAMLAGTQNTTVTHIIAAMSRPQPSRMSPAAKKSGFETSFRDTPSGGTKRFDLPVSYFEDASHYNPLDALSACFKPKLFLFGKKDEIVIPDSVRDTYEKCANPKELHGVDCDHDYRRSSDIIEEINGIVGAFLEKRY